MTRKKKNIPTKHKFKTGDVVNFHFAGSTRIGSIIELTKEEPNDHATYTVKSQGVIYPCLGFKDSKEVGNVLSKVLKCSKDI